MWAWTRYTLVNTPSPGSSQPPVGKGEHIGLLQLDMIRFFFAKAMSMYNTIKNYDFYKRVYESVFF